jgi:hypothetical protein
MKNSFLYRPVLFLLLLVVASMTACKKAPEADPDLGNRVAGTYTLNELTAGGKSYTGANLPLKGTIEVARESATSVELSIDIRLKADNSEFLNVQGGDIDVIDKGGELELRSDGEKVARISGNKMYIEVEDDSDVYTLVLTK